MRSTRFPQKALFFALVLSFSGPFPARSGRAADRQLNAAVKDAACLECHAAGDSTRPAMDYSQLNASAHKDLACVDCHRNAEEQPHPDMLKRVDCLSCHSRRVDIQGQVIERYRDSVHGRASVKSQGGDAATCIDCHGRHDIRGHADPKSMVYKANIPLTCARCHENNQVVMRHDIRFEKPYQEYEQSVHGKALFKDGLLQVAAVCTDCHGVHDIEGPNVSSPLASRPETCGKCHISLYDTYRSSIHGQLHLVEKNPDSPGCVDCHGEHGILSPESQSAPTSRTNIPKTCASCHADAVRMAKYDIDADRLSTYQQSFHGVAQGLGNLNAANCASCHGYHDIYPTSDPRSRVNPDNMLKTCSKCHPKATANFVAGKIHVNPTQKSAGFVYYLRNVLIWMVYAVLAFLVFWVGIDLTRKWRTRG